MKLVADEGVDKPIVDATTAGVLLIRLAGLAPETKARLVTDTVQTHLGEMLDAFSVITPGLLRIRSR